MRIQLTPRRNAICHDISTPFELLLRLQAPAEDFPHSQPSPLNLALVIDRSGSMSGNEITEAKRCAQILLDRLGKDDKVAVVQYNSTVDNLLELMPALVAQPLARIKLEGITAEGGTALHGGWLQGAELLAPDVANERLSRVILLSDGQANEGLTNTATICQQVEQLALAGVSTTTVGLGADFNETLMTGMARAGRGGAHYGERAQDLAEAFEAELELLKHLAWKSVRLRINGTEEIQIINDYPKQDGAWQIPSIAVGAEAWALLRMPVSIAARMAESTSNLSVQIEALDCNGKIHTFMIPFPELPVVDSTTYQMMNEDELVIRRGLELKAAEIQFNAAKAARHGDWSQVESLINQIEELGKDHPWIAASINFLQELLRNRDSERMSKEMAYKSVSFSRRLSDINEKPIFCLSDEIQKPVFLRRKTEAGRSSSE